MNVSRRLTRSNTDRLIGGVAGGVAHYLDVDPMLVRLGFVLLVLVGGVSPFIYLILWAVLPNENAVGQAFSEQVRQNIAEMEQRATAVASKVGSQVSQLVGSDQANAGQSAQSTPPTADQNQQGQGPATGPTTRL